MGNDQDLKSKNTSCYVQVLSVGADSACTVPSVLLFFDRQRYLFNVGEGFQRFCTEHHIRMSKVSSVLTTRVTTEATGGLPGMLITMADTSCGGLLSGHSGISLYGPPGLKGTVNAFRTFVNVKDLGLKVSEFDGQIQEGQTRTRPIVKNELVTIRPILVNPEGQIKNEAEQHQPAPVTTQVDGTEPEAKRQRVELADGMEIPTVNVEGPAACYIIELSDIPGKFLPQKAASLGIPRGPLYGKLARGEAVVGASGITVKPEDVMEEGTPGPVILVADCPSEAFLASLVSKEGLGGCLEDESLKKKVACIVHLAPPDVMRLPAYLTWMNAFGGEVSHIAAAAQGSAAGGPVLRKSAILQAKLNALDSGIFPLAPAVSSESEEASALPAECQVGANMLRYHLRPLNKKGMDTTDCADAFDADAVKQQLRTDLPQVFQLAETASGAPTTTAENEASNDTPNCVKSATGDEVQVTFLGTGAAVPSKYRNVTGILVDIPKHSGSMLMDCGEGSWGQMRRRFGGAAADDILRRLSVVWISHIHADHHVGLPSLLAARSRLLGPDCPPVLVIGPRPLKRALIAYAKLEPMKFRYIEAALTQKQDSTLATSPTVPQDVTALIKQSREALGLSRLESFKVVHCAHSYGLILESEEASSDPWKIVFSGDTRPCEAVVEAAKGATLLIHEATFEDELADEAEAKKHSTTKEAVVSGARAGAYRTLLTHFSQRYPKVPVIDDNFVGHVGIAFDLMTVSLKDLPRLPQLVPALKTLFEGDEQKEGEEEEEPVPEMLS